jgi:hypothetical protein
MEAKKKETGYMYHIEENVLKAYQKKPLHLRLQWLYMGNCLRKGYDKKIKDIQDAFRKGQL